MMLTIVLIFILSILLSILIAFILIYNKFQRLDNGAEAGLSQIKVALKKRLDMITQLADVVKSYAKFERKVIENVTKMRSLVKDDIGPRKIDKINKESGEILKRIFLVVESYPDLKASKNFNDLMESIEDVEGEISRQRYTYNNIVQEYNTRLETIPSNIVAKIFSYKKLEYLKFKKDINKNPELEMTG